MDKDLLKKISHAKLLRMKMDLKENEVLLVEMPSGSSLESMDIFKDKIQMLLDHKVKVLVYRGEIKFRKIKYAKNSIK